MLEGKLDEEGGEQGRRVVSEGSGHEEYVEHWVSLFGFYR